MDATREHVSVSAEWLTAAVFLLATLLVALLVVRELRVLPRTGASATAPGAQVLIPPEAVSVPSLMLKEGEEIRVGDAVDASAARLDRAATLDRQGTERGPFGSRDVREYVLAGTRIYVVFEPFEMRGAPRVAAIYLR